MSIATVRTNDTHARQIAAMYVRSGLPCEIDATPTGVIVYAASREIAERVGRLIASAARARDPRASCTTAQHDSDERAETAWWCAVDFDLSTTGGSR